MQKSKVQLPCKSDFFFFALFMTMHSHVTSQCLIKKTIILSESSAFKVLSDRSHFLDVLLPRKDATIGTKQAPSTSKTQGSWPLTMYKINSKCIQGEEIRATAIKPLQKTQWKNAMELVCVMTFKITSKAWATKMRIETKVIQQIHSVKK